MSKKIKFCPNCGSIVGAYVEICQTCGFNLAPKNQMVDLKSDSKDIFPNIEVQKEPEPIKKAKTPHIAENSDQKKPEPPKKAKTPHLVEPIQQKQPEPIKQPIQPNQKSIVEPIKESIETPKETVIEPPKEMIIEQPIQPNQESIAEPIKESIETPKETVIEQPIQLNQESIAEPIKESIETPKETVIEQTIQPNQESITEPIKESINSQQIEKESIKSKKEQKGSNKESHPIWIKFSPYLTEFGKWSWIVLIISALINIFLISVIGLRLISLGLYGRYILIHLWDFIRLGLLIAISFKWVEPIFAPKVMAKDWDFLLNDDASIWIKNKTQGKIEIKKRIPMMFFGGIIITICSPLYIIGLIVLWPAIVLMYFSPYAPHNFNKRKEEIN